MGAQKLSSESSQRTQCKQSTRRASRDVGECRATGQAGRDRRGVAVVVLLLLPLLLLLIAAATAIAVYFRCGSWLTSAPPPAFMSSKQLGIARCFPASMCVARGMDEG
eukprot:15118638-Alexandrium_andersonii.AAC.1